MCKKEAPNAPNESEPQKLHREKWLTFSGSLKYK